MRRLYNYDDDIIARINSICTYRVCAPLTVKGRRRRDRDGRDGKTCGWGYVQQTQRVVVAST